MGRRESAPFFFSLAIARFRLRNRLCAFCVPVSVVRVLVLPGAAPVGLKIAQIAPLYEAVPPRLYGGTERVVANLTDALVDLGHSVTLFASAESRTKATLVPFRDQALRLDDHPLKSDLAAHLAMLRDVAKRAD